MQLLLNEGCAGTEKALRAKQTRALLELRRLGRQLKADEQPKAWLNATLAVRSVKGQMVKRRERLMQRLESGSWPAGRKWAGDRRFRFSNKSESVFCAEELMAFGGNASVEAFELSVQRWSQLMRMLRVDMDVHALRDVLSAGRGMHPLEPHVNTIANYEEVQAAFEPAGLSQLLRTAPKAAPGVPMGDAGAVLSPLSREGSEVPDIFTCPALDELVPCAAERYRGNLSLPCTACLPGPGVKTKFVASVSQPPVKLDKPLYLMVAVPPFWGSTALTGLLSTSPAIATMCSNTSWACESTESLVKSGILHKWSVWARSGTNWSDVYDFYNRSGTWSNDSRPIRLDKNPPNIAKTRELLDFFEKRGMDYRFIVAARRRGHILTAPRAPLRLVGDRFVRLGQRREELRRGALRLVRVELERELPIRLLRLGSAGLVAHAQRPARVLLDASERRREHRRRVLGARRGREE